MKCRAILTAASLSLLAGCVPPGEPPDGVIVSNPHRAPMGRKQAAETLIASFTMFMSSHMRGAEVYCTSPCALQTLANEMLSEAKMVAGVRVVPTARLMLELSEEGNVWTARIKDADRVLWTDCVETSDEVGR